MPASPEDARITADPHGQWASVAEASSSYTPTKYGPMQAAGGPKVVSYGDYADAWASRTEDGQEEWLKLAYATPVPAVGVRVRQTFNPGAVSKVEVFSADGRSAVVWSGQDTTAYEKNKIVWFSVTFAPPPFPVQSVKLTINSAAVKGWNEIDAVQLVGSP